ncbi:hypothetical protein ACNUDN_14970 [Mycobacterium sp. smrl_JER01]|uniref:DUF7159 family protein n=1 Tax=Mycobacterium sp. smrl_JER01 TaxID=3402633 RepID=UPI003AC3F935
MDAVLGLSVTPSAVGVVLVEGHDVDGATLDGAGFAVGGNGAADAARTSEQATAAVRRSEAVAADLGRRVHSIGVTWSDEADAEATLLLKSLSAAGFDNIVAVRLSEATDALARRIAQVMGLRTTAVCVVEPGQLIALVATEAGAVQTAVNHSVVTEQDLVGWLSAVFARADWEPEALVLVGSAEDLDGLAPILEDALAVPVVSPAAAQLALARGAALACARTGDLDLGPEPADARETSTATKQVARVGPAALLAAGVLTFVASVSAAVAVALTPEQPAPPRPSADTAAVAPAAPRPAPPPAAPSADPQPAAEVVVAEPTPPSAPPPAVADVMAPEPVSAIEPSLTEAGMPDPGMPDPGVPGVAPELALPPHTDVPPDLALPVEPVAGPDQAPPVPQERPGILQRIRDRLSNADGDDVQPVAPPPAVGPQP